MLIGMRFKITIKDFVERYNKVIEETEDELSVPLFQINESDFSYLGTNNTADVYGYIRYVGGNMASGNSQERFAIGIYLEKGSDKIVQVSFSAENTYLNSLTDEQQSFLFYHDLPQVIMAVDNTLTMDSAKAKIDNAINSIPHINFENNVAITATQNSEVTMIAIAAMSNEVYKKNYNGTNNQIISEGATDNTTTNSSKVAEIEQMIGFLNSYYDLNFNPTDEQMQEIIEFSNTTDEFNNDTLMEFILQKGWTVSGTGTVDNSSGTTSNSNNSSSNNKNTNKNSNDNNTSTYEEIKATLSINIKDLINNSTDPEVETILQSNTLQVSIFVEESEEKSEYLMYHGGIDSIPNTITQEFTFKTTNNKSIKSNVRIVIDNTSTMIRESTLYDKSITFDKTGTYTIK